MNKWNIFYTKIIKFKKENILYYMLLFYTEIKF